MVRTRGRPRNRGSAMDGEAPLSPRFPKLNVGRCYPMQRTKQIHLGTHYLVLGRRRAPTTRICGSLAVLSHRRQFLSEMVDALFDNATCSSATRRRSSSTALLELVVGQRRNITLTSPCGNGVDCIMHAVALPPWCFGIKE